MQLRTIDDVRERAYGVLELLRAGVIDTASAAAGRLTVRLRVHGKDMAGPEVGIVLTGCVYIERIVDFRRHSWIKPSKPVDVGAASPLELVAVPKVVNTELGLKDDVEEGLEALVEVPGGDMRVGTQVSPIDRVSISTQG